MTQERGLKTPILSDKQSNADVVQGLRGSKTPIGNDCSNSLNIPRTQYETNLASSALNRSQSKNNHANFGN